MGPCAALFRTSLLKFRCETPYRFYTLAKVGFSLAYFWYVLDFFRIHLALLNGMSVLFHDASSMSFAGIEGLDFYLRYLAAVLSTKAAVWIFFLASPLAIAIYLWGRHRWLQFGTGLWISFSMISLSAVAGVFNTNADIWVHYAFLTYCLSALFSTDETWERCESGFSRDRWNENPALNSTYAWLIVLLQFTVYFYAGVNKLVFGWGPWTGGTALQNLAFDSSMHEFARGIVPPFWLSFILCYVTLFQRLVVPFGFYVRRFRLWSVLILGAMHIGYAILMYVNLFPTIGIACLLMILPPRPEGHGATEAPKPAQKKKAADRDQAPGSFSRAFTLSCLSLWLLLEPLRLCGTDFATWEAKFLVVPEWRMFADGGVTAGGKWRIMLQTPQGDVEATELSLALLPHLWRERFYVDAIYHDVLADRTGPGSLSDLLLQNTENRYRQGRLADHTDPTVLNGRFDYYVRNPQN
jgi:Vitamin K-dependent gamma-carboxylase